MSASPITDFQAEVARVFFALPEAGSFLLAGGLALVAQGLTDRPTEDLDVFTSRAGDVSQAVDAFARAAAAKHWTVDIVQASDTVVRLSVAGQDELIVDIALDSPPDLPPTMSILGPTFAPKGSLRGSCWRSSTGRCRATSSISSASSSAGIGMS